MGRCPVRMVDMCALFVFEVLVVSWDHCIGVWLLSLWQRKMLYGNMDG